MDILNISEEPTIDESTEIYKHHEYTPQTVTNPNNPSEIIISIGTQNLFTHRSDLVFTG